MWRDKTILGITIAAIIVVAVSFFLPSWLLNQALFGFARALAVIGLMVLWRTGLVSFGHALYFGGGAYAAALLSRYYEVSDFFVLLLAGIVATTIVGFVLGFIIRRYRDIFFAMLSLAFSMILYGVLVKTEALGSTDGFAVSSPTFLFYAPEPGDEAKQALFVALVIAGWLAAVLVQMYLNSTLGRLTTAIRDNEIRVEYLGFSAEHAIHVKYVMSAALAGAGGAFMAMSLGQVDPDSMVNWTASGELVFVTILSGPGSVAAPFVGSFIFELLRTYAVEFLPHSWQIIVGATLLIVIFFLPGGVWSLLSRLRRAEG